MKRNLSLFLAICVAAHGLVVLATKMPGDSKSILNEEPLEDCWVNPKWPKEICAEVSTKFCTINCKQCCQNKNACIPNSYFVYKDGKNCIVPPLPRCFKDTSLSRFTSDGKMCSPAFQVFCKQGCTTCCVNDNGCTPSLSYRYTKSDDGKCLERPKPIPECRLTRSYGSICPKIITTFCTKDCITCCIANNACSPSTDFSYRFINGKCIPPPPPPPPSQCIESKWKDPNEICEQVPTTFCDQKCRCCKHRNTCNPDPDTYFIPVAVCAAANKCPSPPKQCSISSCDPRVFPCPFEHEQCQEKCSCEPTCSQCPFKLTSCERNPCETSANICPKGSVCEVNNCGGCNVVCKAKRCPYPRKQCSTLPCSPGLNPCGKDEACTQDCNCSVVCTPKPVCPKGCTPYACETYPCSGCSCPNK